MNAITLNITPASSPDPAANASARFNEWRGSCLDAFTRAECAVTECLIVMSEVSALGEHIARPHHQGQRADELTKAISDAGPFAADGSRSVAVLQQYRSFTDLRNMFCHGTASVTTDEQGSWTATCRLATFKSSRLVRERLVLTESDATVLLVKLKRVSHQVCCELGGLRNKIANTPTMVLDLS